MTAVSAPAKRAPRVRTYFKSREIAHQWAHQLVPHGRSPSAMRFTGPAFYSYNTCIARIIEYKGRKAYVLDTHKYSVTTSSHQSTVRSAIPHGAVKFFIEDTRSGSMNFTPQTLRDEYLAVYKSDCDSKLERMRAHHLVRAAHALDEAIRVCEVFGLGHKKLLREREDIKPALETARTVIAEWEKGRDERAAKAAATRRANIIARAEAFIADPENSEPMRWRDIWRLPDDVRSRYEAACPANERAAEERVRKYRAEKLAKYIEDPANNERPYFWELTPEQQAQVQEADKRRDAAVIEQWYRGEKVRLGQHESAYLRRVDEHMETSLGVTVPIADAERAFRFISALRKAGKDWRRNGETFAIGQWQLDSVTAAGVIAGCHRVNWAEIDRFAASQGWVVTE